MRLKKILMFQGLLFPCASQSDTTVTLTENRRRKIIKTTAVQKDEVLDCLDTVEINSFIN